MAKQVKNGQPYLIHNNKATGTTSVLYDNDEYIARRNGYNGNPGLVVYINNSG
jgi:alpha-amylase